MVFMKVCRLQKKEKKLESSVFKPYLTENTSCSPAVPYHSQASFCSLLQTASARNPGLLSVSKASSQGEQAHRDSCEEETFLKGEQIFTEATAFPYLSEEHRSRPSVAFR